MISGVYLTLFSIFDQISESEMRLKTAFEVDPPHYARKTVCVTDDYAITLKVSKKIWKNIQICSVMRSAMFM
jgi:hypothetical protein